MKNYALILCILTIMPCFGQGVIDSLVGIGVKYHDKGNYKKAIEAYNEALKVDPKSALANYELSLTYMQSGDYEKAIKYSEAVINQKKDFIIPAYLIKGSALDNSGKSEQSIKLFKGAIAELGDNYLLYYNLGISYSAIQDNENAESAFIKAIANNSAHASSHYALAFIEKRLDKRVQSLLSLYYFLLLESSSKRSETAYKALKEQLSNNVQKDKNDSTKINILLSSSEMDSEFASAEGMLAILEASKLLEENKNKTAEELFINNTEAFFGLLGESSKEKKKANIWQNFYIPFFYKLSKSEYMDVFCYYISMSSDKKAKEWLVANYGKFEKFEKWMKENK